MRFTSVKRIFNTPDRCDPMTHWRIIYFKEDPSGHWVNDCGAVFIIDVIFRRRNITIGWHQRMSTLETRSPWLWLWLVLHLTRATYTTHAPLSPRRRRRETRLIFSVRASPTCMWVYTTWFTFTLSRVPISYTMWLTLCYIWSVPSTHTTWFTCVTFAIWHTMWSILCCISSISTTRTVPRDPHCGTYDVFSILIHARATQNSAGARGIIVRGGPHFTWILSQFVRYSRHLIDAKFEL